MEQPQMPDFSNYVTPTTNGPTPAATTPVTNGAPTPPAVDAPVPAAPLTPMGWLSQNAIYFLVFAAIVGAILYYQGFGGIVKWTIVAVGLGVVVFVHELGHFAAAKWCNVHVQTFSLGFGPALPGCSFRRGETLYKIAVLPLGGYVSMVGEGFEDDQEENYPRSFKNKTVGQRMVIISAGVVMNMILGCICFVAVFYFHGVEHPKAIVDSVEPASPAWTQGVRRDDRIARIGSKENPHFDDLRASVLMTTWKEPLSFVFEPRHGGEARTIELIPRRDSTDDAPVIGVSPWKKLQLPPEHFKTVAWEVPATYGSAADRARVIPFQPGEVVLKAKADGDEIVPSEGESFVSWVAFAEWVGKRPDKTIGVDVSGKPPGTDKGSRTVTLSPDGFHFGDRIVGTTKADQPRKDYDPLLVDPLPLDPDGDPNTYDVFEFSKRIKRLAGRPLVLQVRHEDQAADAAPINLLIPPSFTPTTGMVMEMGRVAGVRINSPAERAKVLPGDTITRIEFGGSDGMTFDRSKDDDPVRLPFEMERVAHELHGPKTVRITVVRPKQNGPEGAGDDPHKGSVVVQLDPVEWDDSWDDALELPPKPTSPMSIPQLGVAYWVNCTVVRVVPGSPAASLGIQRGDRVAEVAVLTGNKTKDDTKEKWSDFEVLETTRDGRTEHDQWAFYGLSSQGLFYLDRPTFKLKIVRDNAPLKGPAGSEEIVLKADYDPTWPSEHLGLALAYDTKLEKASSVWDALRLGLKHTGATTAQLYMGMRSVATNRIKITKGFGGPVAIANEAFARAADPSAFLLFMGMISINLAVLNFLPIPVLDGGHMVFLIYEKIRGKPPSDEVRKWLTIGGLVLLGLLMLLAFSLDLSKLFRLIK